MIVLQILASMVEVVLMELQSIHAAALMAIQGLTAKQVSFGNNIVNSSTCFVLIWHWLLFFWLDINDCSPNPCVNGGNCTDGVASYTCSCANGYTGTDCETS